MFVPATRENLKLRMAIDGPAGSGKTYTGLRFAQCLTGGKKIAVADSERGSARKYIGEMMDGKPVEFDVCELSHFAPATYTSVIKHAEAAGQYGVLLIDGLSAAWEGLGGALDQVDKSKEKNSFTAWKDVTPQHREMIDAIINSSLHVIVTMRSKMQYEVEKDASGKSVPVKLGMGPIQRAGMEYEFDIVVDMDQQHRMTVSKTRCSAIDGYSEIKPGMLFMSKVTHWLSLGAPPAAAASAAPAAAGSPIPQAITPGESQRYRVIELCRAMEWPPQALSDMVRARGADKLAQLPDEDVDALIAKLEGLVMRKNESQFLST